MANFLSVLAGVGIIFLPAVPLLVIYLLVRAFLRLRRPHPKYRRFIFGSLTMVLGMVSIASYAVFFYFRLTASDQLMDPESWALLEEGRDTFLPPVLQWLAVPTLLICPLLTLAFCFLLDYLMTRARSLANSSDMIQGATQQH